jgi:hypothetical protein
LVPTACSLSGASVGSLIPVGGRCRLGRPAFGRACERLGWALTARLSSVLRGWDLPQLSVGQSPVLGTVASGPAIVD